MAKSAPKGKKKPLFGGKKSAPFQSGGGRKPTGAAKKSSSKQGKGT